MRIAATIAASLICTAAWAQDRTPSHCHALSLIPGVEYLHRAAVNTPLPDAETVRISYVEHAMFLVEAGETSVVTDFNGYLGPTLFLPDVVTMNHAHITHWTPRVSSDVPHVLPGWGDTQGEGIAHYLDLGDMVIRNVPTDIRSFGGVEEKGNSIFIFEAAGLCIGHLGHLHHEPSPEQYTAIGRLDVVMAPVDGGMTVPVETMITILKRLKSSIVIPMHWFGDPTLQRFLVGMSNDFQIVRTEDSVLEVGLHKLPGRPTVIVLEPAYLD